MRTARWLVIGWMTTVPVVAQQPSAELAATVRQLHQTVIKPASDVIFKVGREAPANNEEWTAISDAAADLRKSGTLLMRASPPEDRAKWIALCRQLVTAGRTTRREADARKLAALKRTSDRLVVVCETCHASYRNRGVRP